MTPEQKQTAIQNDPRTVADIFENLPYFSLGLLKAKLGETWTAEMLATLGRYDAQIEAAFPAEEAE